MVFKSVEGGDLGSGVEVGSREIQIDGSFLDGSHGSLYIM